MKLVVTKRSEIIPLNEKKSRIFNVVVLAYSSNGKANASLSFCLSVCLSLSLYIYIYVCVCVCVCVCVKDHVTMLSTSDEIVNIQTHYKINPLNLLVNRLVSGTGASPIELLMLL